MGTLRSQVSWVAENTRKNVNDWVSIHHQNVQVLARLVGDPNTNSFATMQWPVEIMKAATPEFKGMGVFNDRAVSVSYAPLNQDGRSNVGVDMAGRAHIAVMKKDKKPYITDILMSKLGDPCPIVVFLAPIILSGEYKGYSSGVLEIRRISGMLENLKMPGTQISLVDGNNKVIASTVPGFETMAPFLRTYRDSHGIASSQTLLWRPEPQPNVSLMQQWADSVLFNEAPVSSNCRWRVIVEASLLPVAESTSRYCLFWMSLMGLLIFAVVLVSHHLSNCFIASVKKLQVATRSVPDKLNGSIPMAWPDSVVLELAELSANFQEMTAALHNQITEQSKAKEALRQSLEEKTSLLKEVHHRVKNNLQIVTSLLGLQSTRTDNRQALDILEDTASRVRSMALLHETLYRSGNLARINLASYLKTLCDHLLLSSGVSLSRITLEYCITPIEFPLEPALPCGLIVNELVSNALKHGFPENRPGTIRIELKQSGGQTLVLSVEGNGTCLPPGFDPGSMATLGIRLVTGLVNQLKGELRVDMPRDSGTLFSVIFPMPDDSAIQDDPMTDNDGVYDSEQTQKN
jgi:two-component sensor histidine kinase